MTKLSVRRICLSLALPLGLAACAAGGETAITQLSRADGEGTLFVANKFGNTLSRIDLAIGQEVGRVDSCANPHELATSPDSAYVALACYGGTSVDIFAARDLSRVASIDLGAGARPHGIVWHANGDLYATAEGRQSIFRIVDPLSDAPRPIEYATGQQGTHMLVVAPDGRTAWTTNLGAKTVSRVDLTGKAASRAIEVGLEPEGIALTPDGGTLWVSARGSDKAFALDPATLDVRRTVDTGAFPLRIAVRPQNDVAITSDLRNGALSVIDLDKGTVVRTIAVSSPEEAEERFQVTILWSPDGERIYVAETGTDTIAEIDYASGKVVRRLVAGDGGDGLAIIS